MRYPDSNNDDLKLSSLRRRYLDEDIAKILVEQILRGTWKEWLPNERDLAKQLGVSRNTLRAALSSLEKKEVFETIPGKGRRILLSCRETRDRLPNSIGLLTSQTLSEMRPYVHSYVDEIRLRLLEQGFRLRVIAKKNLAGRDLEPKLERLIECEPQRVWILFIVGDRVQKWFQMRGIPAVVMGSCYPNVDLPSLDLDWKAVTRHAAGTLFGKGHCQIALMLRNSGAAGETECAKGFEEALRLTGAGNTGQIVFSSEVEVSDICRKIRRLFEGDDAPTALIVGGVQMYLTVFTFMVELGYSIPRDVSLICRDDEAFLRQLRPEPARYSVSPKVMAKRLHSLLMKVMGGATLQEISVLVMPKYLKGKSVAKLV